MFSYTYSTRLGAVAAAASDSNMTGGNKDTPAQLL